MYKRRPGPPPEGADPTPAGAGGGSARAKKKNSKNEGRPHTPHDRLRPRAGSPPRREEPPRSRKRPPSRAARASVAKALSTHSLDLQLMAWGEPGMGEPQKPQPSAPRQPEPAGSSLEQHSILTISFDKGSSAATLVSLGTKCWLNRLKPPALSGSPAVRRSPAAARPARASTSSSTKLPRDAIPPRLQQPTGTWVPALPLFLALLSRALQAREALARCGNAPLASLTPSLVPRSVACVAVVSLW
mmetsp:Transcript_18586/g.45669  ORF Transcript_18586/g.45669 Transcript_18586/m.45669 type:complete len:245 (-) Transcript_18586:12-746(-)